MKVQNLIRDILVYEVKVWHIVKWVVNFFFFLICKNLKDVSLSSVV